MLCIIYRATAEADSAGRAARTGKGVERALMEGKKPHALRHIVLHVLSISFYISWASIVLRGEICPALDPVPLYLLVLVAVAGFLSATLLDRFLVRRASSVLGIVSVVLLAALSVLPKFMPYSRIGALIAAYLLFFGLFLLLVPVFKKTVRRALLVFNGTLLVLAPLLFGQAALIGIESWNRDTALVFALINLAAAFVLGLAAGKTAVPEEEAPVLLRIPSSPVLFVSFCAVTLAGCIALTMHIAGLLERPALDSTLAHVSGVALFVIMQGVSLFLIRTGRIWQMSYIVFTAFAMGVLLLWVELDHVVFMYLPLMLLIASVSGMVLLFFTFMQSMLTPINRAFVVGLTYIFTMPLIFLFLYTGSIPESDDSDRIMSLIVVAAVLLVTPLFFRTFDSRKQAGTGDGADAQRLFEDDSAAGEGMSNDFETTFTGAERRVYELILMGYSNQQIADELFVSINTVKFHVRNILAKSGMQSKNQLVSLHLKKQKT